MRVLPIIALFAVVAHSATIYDALVASKQFTNILAVVDKVPQLRNILSDPGVQVTFFAPSDNALTNTPFQKPFRYLFPGIVDISNIKAGSRYNYRGEQIAFDTNDKHFGMRTEYIFLPGISPIFQSRILRAPLRKEDGLLENGNLYYIDRVVYSCGELTRAQCAATADDQCRGKCDLRYEAIPGTDVAFNVGDLSFQFNPPATLPPARVNGPAGAPGTGVGAPPAPAPVANTNLNAPAVGTTDTYVDPDTVNDTPSANAPAGAPGTAAAPKSDEDVYEEAQPIGYGSPDPYGYGLGYYGR